MDERRRSGFQHRLSKEGAGYEEAAENFFRLCAGPEEPDRYLQAAREALTPVPEHIRSMTGEDDERCGQETAFYHGLPVRLLLSAVIEGKGEFNHHPNTGGSGSFVAEWRLPKDDESVKDIYLPCLWA